MEVEQPPATDREQPRPPVASPEVIGQKLQILTAEHFGLLNARSQSWSESFSRVSMFLSVLTGSVISLALIAQAAHFGSMFVGAAALILTVDLIVGIITVSRLLAINQEDVRWTAGINRLRHGYLEFHPDLAPYFITGSHDDASGLAATLGWYIVPRGALARLANGSTSLPGMIGVLVSVIAAVVGALIAISAQLSLLAIIALGGLCFVVTAWALTVYTRRKFSRFMAALPVAFPTPSEP